MNHMIPAVLLLAIAACSPEPADAPVASTVANEATPPTPAPPRPEATPPAAAPPAATTSAAGAPSLAVDAEGLRLFRASGSALPIPFGTARAEALRMLQFRGPPGTGTQEECSSGPLAFAVWPDGLKLYFQKDRFTGWALDKRARGAVATAAGVGPGVTRSSVEEAIVIKIAKTSLGNEFSSGELNGLFDGPAANSQITDMWAGTSCIFR